MSSQGKARILIVIGTRPEAIKLAPLVHTLRREPAFKLRVLATAQHREMLDDCLEFFSIASDLDLDLQRDNQELADLSSRMLRVLDGVLVEEQPDLVIAQGDTSSVMIAGLACHYRQIPFAHLEAGLRSGDREHPFPEEMNRRMLGSLADLHFAPTEAAAANLLAEGVGEEQVYVTGNTVIDALHWTLPRVDREKFAPTAGQRRILVTAHRRESIGAGLEGICQGLRRLAAREDLEILFPVHPNPKVREQVHTKLEGQSRIRLLDPLSYPDFVAAMQSSDLILSDSGGVQEEAPSLNKPVLVLRERTERQEGIDAGCARLVGRDAGEIYKQASLLLDDAGIYAEMAKSPNPYGDGKATGRIVPILASCFAD
ncbi:MAG: non-hydrolyzing UDP-N-acetylglucosamine 2-epimerase [Planctomycetota bacterium]|jgi:UDP-N-acetylglucosamine 2-epimerase (non-hydrolysing)